MHVGSASTRPYRSKRRPPCDQCRQKKLRCQGDGQQSCQRCLSAGSLCSFSGFHHRPRDSLPVSPSTPERDWQTPPILIEPASQSTVNSASYMRCQSEPTVNLDPWIESLQASREYIESSRRPTPQTIQTLDSLHQFSYQVIGASGESDPWLFRHCRFDDRGFLSFHHIHFRNAGGVPLDEKIPVHFLVTDDQLYNSTKQDTKLSQERNIRAELDTLVPLDLGQRLVALFLRFIFPVLPIISRSRLGVTQNKPIPDKVALQEMPVHLLAAIYASVQPFTQFDEHISVWTAYSSPPTEQLWRLVLEAILTEIHTPHLCTLQAGLLYLNRSTGSATSTVADSGLLWSLVGMFVGLATTLGLQLECRPMGLPSWERRLRRRLWWAIYAEDKWRSLLMGRPPYIRNDEWDVTDLDNDDFHKDELFHTPVQPDSEYAVPFQWFVRLSRVADEIQHQLYSLRAAQRLSSNFNSTLEVARPLLQKLKEWYSLLPSSLKQRARPTAAIDEPFSPSSCLRFGYVLLEIYIFRALLRPMVLSAAPPPLFEESEDFMSFMNQVNECAFENNGVDDGEPVPAIDISDENGAGNAALKAAENCATKTLGFVMRMTNGDLSEFWFSWSRIGFATVSSFMMLLLVQSPTKDHAIRARRLVYLWRQTLRTQSNGCTLMNMALVRLDGFLSTDIGRSFYLPKHVKETLDDLF
ncbi:fungal-specific transcription factor domain-containing protein [Aspergillus ambiguus]|uniref:Zn(II)2Cys6 transcription factor n=1 Tax=Aspergillus ambiguus TaxID=176160 RepID=UPI003CCD36C1